MSFQKKILIFCPANRSKNYLTPIISTKFEHHYNQPKALRTPGNLSEVELCLTEGGSRREHLRFKNLPHALATSARLNFA